MNAKAALSYSGTIEGESRVLGFTAATIRDSIERPEAIEVAGIVMTGLKAKEVNNNLEDVFANPPTADRVLPQGYLVTDFSQRVVRLIMSTYGHHHEWAGMRKLG